MFKSQKNIIPFGVDFSDTLVKVAQLRKKGKAVELVGIQRVSIPAGVVKDGEIIDAAVLASCIKSACKACKPSSIKSKFVIYSVPETKGFIRILKLPYLGGGNISKAEILAEAKQFFPIDLNEAYVDWEVIRTNEVKSNVSHLLFAAVPRKVIDNYSNVMRMADLVPIAAEIESVAIARSLINEKIEKDPVLIIDLGRERTGFTIFKYPVIQFSASIPMSMGELNQAIATKFNISVQKAEDLRRKCGLRNSGECAEVYKAMDYNLRELTGYINKLLGYYRANYKNEDIAKVVVCGSEARMPGVCALLSLRIKKEVENGNPWINIFQFNGRVIPPISKSDSLMFATVLGLAIRGLNYNELHNLYDYN